MMKVFVSFLFFLSITLSVAQEFHLKEGEGKKYLATFPDGKGVEYMVYFAGKKDENFWVECKANIFDDLKSFHFWQLYEFKRKSDNLFLLMNAFVFSPEMMAPQKLPAEEVKNSLRFLLAHSLLQTFIPIDQSNAKLNYQFSLQGDVKHRPIIINTLKAKPLDEKGLRIINLPYSCL